MVEQLARKEPEEGVSESEAGEGTLDADEEEKDLTDIIDAYAQS